MLLWRFQQTNPTKPNKAAPRSVPMTIPAFWPPLRPVGPPRPSTGGAGSGTFGEGEGGRELGFGEGEGEGVRVGVGAGVGEGGVGVGAGDGEFGDGAGWASKECNKFENKITSKRRFMMPLLIILTIMFVKPSTMYESLI
jgi:hypothetical protein